MLKYIHWGSLWEFFLFYRMAWSKLGYSAVFCIENDMASNTWQNLLPQVCFYPDFTKKKGNADTEVTINLDGNWYKEEMVGEAPVFSFCALWAAVPGIGVEAARLEAENELQQFISHIKDSLLSNGKRVLLLRYFTL